MVPERIGVSPDVIQSKEEKSSVLWREYKENDRVVFMISAEFENELKFLGVDPSCLIDILNEKIEVLSMFPGGESSIDPSNGDGYTINVRRINKIGGEIENMIGRPMVMKNYVEERRIPSLSREYKSMLYLRKTEEYRLSPEQREKLSVAQVYALINKYDECGNLSGSYMFMEYVEGEMVGPWEDVPEDLARVFCEPDGEFYSYENITGGCGWVMFGSLLRKKGFVEADDVVPRNMIKQVKAGRSAYRLIDQGGV